MIRLQCELCGSTDIVKEGEYFVCQYCGCKYLPDDLRKNLPEKDEKQSDKGIDVDAMIERLDKRNIEREKRLHRNDGGIIYSRSNRVYGDSDIDQVFREVDRRAIERAKARLKEEEKENKNAEDHGTNTTTETSRYEIRPEYRPANRYEHKPDKMVRAVIVIITLPINLAFLWLSIKTESWIFWMFFLIWAMFSWLLWLDG